MVRKQARVLVMVEGKMYDAVAADGVKGGNMEFMIFIGTEPVKIIRGAAGQAEGKSS